MKESTDLRIEFTKFLKVDPGISDSDLYSLIEERGKSNPAFYMALSGIAGVKRNYRNAVPVRRFENVTSYMITKILENWTHGEEDRIFDLDAVVQEENSFIGVLSLLSKILKKQILSVNSILELEKHEQVFALSCVLRRRVPENLRFGMAPSQCHGWTKCATMLGVIIKFQKYQD